MSKNKKNIDLDNILEKYNTLNNLVIDENRLTFERSQIFMLVITLLFTVFSLVKDEFLLRLAILIIGIILNLLWIYVNIQTGIALRFWRTQIHFLEEKYLGGEKWGMYTARALFWKGEYKLPKLEIDDMDKTPKNKNNFFMKFVFRFSVLKIILIGVPIIFLCLWISVLIEFII